MISEIDTQQNVIDILQRFPTFVRNKWKKRALEFKQDKDAYRTFSDFLKFANKVAIDSCDPVYGAVSSKSFGAKGEIHHSVTSPSFPGHAVSSGNAQSQYDNPRPAASSIPKPCLVCQQPHRLFHCGKFKSMAPKARLELVKHHKLCFNCLYDNHHARDCYKKSVCSVPGCGQKHKSVYILIPLSMLMSMVLQVKQGPIKSLFQMVMPVLWVPVYSWRWWR